MAWAQRAPAVLSQAGADPLRWGHLISETVGRGLWKKQALGSQGTGARRDSPRPAGVRAETPQSPSGSAALQGLLTTPRAPQHLNLSLSSGNRTSPYCLGLVPYEVSGTVLRSGPAEHPHSCPFNPEAHLLSYRWIRRLGFESSAAGSEACAPNMGVWSSLMVPTTNGEVKPATRRTPARALATAPLSSHPAAPGFLLLSSWNQRPGRTAG